MNKLLLATLILVFSSCQTQKKWLKKGHEKGWLKDSVITKYDTLRGFKTDSIYFFDTLHSVDTITTIKDGLKVSTVIKWKTREVRQVITQRDTILEHKYTTKVLKEKRKWWEKYTEPFFYFILVCFLVFVFDLIKTALRK